MKKIVNFIRRWRYRRLYHRLFMFFAKTNAADEAGYQAAASFTWLTGREWKDWC